MPRNQIRKSIEMPPQQPKRTQTPSPNLRNSGRTMKSIRLERPSVPPPALPPKSNTIKSQLNNCDERECCC